MPHESRRAKAAYEAFCASPGIARHTFDFIPAFERLTPEVQQAWDDTAAAVEFVLTTDAVDAAEFQIV